MYTIAGLIETPNVIFDDDGTETTLHKIEHTYVMFGKEHTEVIAEFNYLDHAVLVFRDAYDNSVGGGLGGGEFQTIRLIVAANRVEL